MADETKKPRRGRAAGEVDGSANGEAEVESPRGKPPRQANGGGTTGGGTTGGGTNDGGTTGGGTSGGSTTADAPPKIEYVSVSLSQDFKDRASELDKLLVLPSTLKSGATRAHDGRLLRLVLVTVHDRAGRSRAGIPLQLLDGEKNVVDRAFTSRTGFAILRFPRPPAGADPVPLDTPVRGTVRILDGSKDGMVQAVDVPGGRQFADVTLMLEDLPRTEESTVTGRVAKQIDRVELWPPAGLGDDPLNSLPADFTPELCDALAAKIGDDGDSLLGKLGDPTDFRSRRTPLIKRLSVVRNGDLTVSPNSTEPRRYLVRLRQSWVFLGYTLGELAEVDALDPGAVLDETVGTVERSVDQVSRLVDQVRSFATSSLNDTLTQTNKIDTLVNAATSTEVNASVLGFGFGIPGFGIGGATAKAGMRTSATTSTSVDTSLNVNHSISTAQSFVNEAIHQATSQLTSLARTVTTTIGRVSPLLSRVTNLLRWRVYENYAVSTHVEDVLELVSVKVVDIPHSQLPRGGTVSTPVFSPEEIVEYRRFFEAAMLEPRLREEYPALIEAVRVAQSGRSVRSVVVAVNYSAAFATGHLTVRINGAEERITLRAGSGRAVGVVRFDTPVPIGDLRRADLVLTASPTLPSVAFAQQFFENMVSVDVTSATFSAGATAGGSSVDTAPVDLHHAGKGGSVADSVTFDIAPPAVDATRSPLWVHVNQNPSYYLGVLAQAAMAYPSLRDDSDKLREIPEHVWRLPIVGFEGNHIVVAKDPDEGNTDVERLLADPGAATLVQLQAPGAYSEALQGLLSLVDAEGLIHPGLMPAPAPAMPPLTVVDITGKPMVPAASGNGSTAPAPAPATAPVTGATGSAGSTGAAGRGGGVSLPIP